MRTLIVSAAAVAFGLGLSAPAFAQDGPPRGPATPDRAFHGAHAGIPLGYDKPMRGSI